MQKARVRLGPSLDALSEIRRGLTPPRLRDKHLEICHGYRTPSYQHGWEALVMRFSKKLLLVSGQQRILLPFVGYAHSDHTGVWNARFLWNNPLHPDPDEALELPLVRDREGEPITRFLGRGQRQSNATDVSPGCHWVCSGGPPRARRGAICRRTIHPPPRSPRRSPGAARERETAAPGNPARASLRPPRRSCRGVLETTS